MTNGRISITLFLEIILTVKIPNHQNIIEALDDSNPFMHNVER